MSVIYNFSQLSCEVKCIITYTCASSDYSLMSAMKQEFIEVTGSQVLSTISRFVPYSVLSVFICTFIIICHCCLIIGLWHVWMCTDYNASWFVFVNVYECPVTGFVDMFYIQCWLHIYENFETQVCIHAHGCVCMCVWAGAQVCACVRDLSQFFANKYD
jgi:hypothetical protein